MKKGSFHMTMDGTTFTSGSDSTLIFKYSSKDYLPIAYAYTNHAPPSSAFPVSSGQLNISKLKSELLQWHQRLGHYNIRGIQRLMITWKLDVDPVIGS